MKEEPEKGASCRQSLPICEVSLMTQFPPAPLRRAIAKFRVCENDSA